ncbi:hypothetical protein KKF70_06350 [bacterium]|nr:hypothetical protein [bacterium]MBU3929858.1 hypothetical protein [bacterium]MBU4123011.1 hypothetical protein [bacterium]
MAWILINNDALLKMEKKGMVTEVDFRDLLKKDKADALLFLFLLQCKGTAVRVSPSAALNN